MTAAAVQAPEAGADLIDLARYPFLGVDVAVRNDLVERCRARFDATGILVLDGFATPAATALLCAEAEAVMNEAYFCLHRHNVYLSPPDPDRPESDPRNRVVVSDKGNVATDRIPGGGPLRRLYDWAPLRGFIADLLAVPRLYPYGDPLAALMINVNRTGESLGWHFDNSDFAVTLMLRPSAAGGIFRYLPNCRSGDDRERATIARVLDGDLAGAIDLEPDPGALIVFRGRGSLHCVTPVEGDIARLVGVLSYAQEPGQRMSAYAQRLFHGREA